MPTGACSASVETSSFYDHTLLHLRMASRILQASSIGPLQDSLVQFGTWQQVRVVNQTVRQQQPASLDNNNNEAASLPYFYLVQFSTLSCQSAFGVHRIVKIVHGLSTRALNIQTKIRKIMNLYYRFSLRSTLDLSYSTQRARRFGRISSISTSQLRGAFGRLGSSHPSYGWTPFTHCGGTVLFTTHGSRLHNLTAHIRA